MKRNRYYAFECPLCGKKTKHVLNWGKEVRKCDKCKKHFIAELVVTSKVRLWRMSEEWVKEIQL